jgi:hypothetical protein
MRNTAGSNALLFTLVSLAFVLLALSTSSSSAADSAAFKRAVDALCRETGLRRGGQTTLVKEFNDGRDRFWVKVPLVVDGTKHVYDIHLIDNLTVWQFRPTDWPFHRSQIPAGLGADTFKETKTRKFILSVLARFNRARKYKLYGKPAIKKVGSDFVVTYKTISEEEQERQFRNIEREIAVDPYVSFLVSPRGTIFGLFWGA